MSTRDGTVEMEFIHSKTVHLSLHARGTQPQKSEHYTGFKNKETARRRKLGELSDARMCGEFEAITFGETMARRVD